MTNRSTYLQTLGATVFLIMSVALQSQLLSTFSAPSKTLSDLQMEQQLAEFESSEPLFLPEFLIRASSGGLLPVYLDWSWLNVLADDSLLRLPRSQRTRLFYTLMHVTQLEPAYFDAYVLGSSLLAVIRDDVLGARELLLRGEEYRTQKLDQDPLEVQKGAWREQWRIPYLLGYVNLIELEDVPSAARYLQEAAKNPGSPEFVRRLGVKLTHPEGRFQVARNVLEGLLKPAQAEDPDSVLTKELTDKIANLELSAFYWKCNETLNRYINQEDDFMSRHRKFTQLINDGHLPSLDPRGEKVLFLKTSELPNGVISSQKPRKKVMGL